MRTIVKNFWATLIKALDLLLVRMNIRHLHGLRQITCRRDDVVVVCLVRNGGHFIEPFINHYSLLGAKHIVLLDNNSIDDTVVKAKKYRQVTIFSSKALISGKQYIEVYLRQYLANRFCRHGWCLCVDMDEFFDYPGSHVLDLKEFIGYLNSRSYTAVLTQMLDMFSQAPLIGTGESSIEKQQYYDISNIVCHDYFSSRFGSTSKSNVLANSRIKFHTHGIRYAKFGTINYLTKHQLFRPDSAQLVHPHWVAHAHCADISAVCLHYKFAGNFLEIAAQYITERFSVPSEYTAIVTACRDNPQLSLLSETSKEFKSVNELVDTGFLVISDPYRNWIQRHSPRLSPALALNKTFLAA